MLVTLLRHAGVSLLRRPKWVRYGGSEWSVNVAIFNHGSQQPAQPDTHMAIALIPFHLFSKMGGNFQYNCQPINILGKETEGTPPYGKPSAHFMPSSLPS